MLVTAGDTTNDVTVEYTAGDHHRSDGPLFAGTGRAAEAIRDASMHRRAEREAAAQWRSVGVVPCAITSRRLLIRDGERQWQAYPLDTLVSLTPDVQTSALELAFENSASVRLRGPWVPWLTVVISTLQFARPWPPGFPLPTGDGPR
ncbi:hypothetical protein [Dactylosporangium sp. NPDC049140]|uniref:hypothetical protein n=1 Tax=Dactylosporangium sp. NPDC049140 TaxID=3155647 RepID=UPI0033C37CD1